MQMTFRELQTFPQIEHAPQMRTGKRLQVHLFFFFDKDNK